MASFLYEPDLQDGNQAESVKEELEVELRHLQRELKDHDEMVLKFRDLKLDYSQLLKSYEKSEQIRRDQKQMIKLRGQEIQKLNKLLRQAERELARTKSRAK